MFGAEKTYAATNNFTADGGEWNTAGNWSLGHVPDNTEDATFTGIVTAGVTLTVTSGNAYAKSIDFSTAGATFTFSYSSQVTSYGSVTLKTGMTMSQSGYMSFNINGSGTLTTNGVAFPYAISLWSGADVTLADALTINNGGLAVNPYSGGDTTLITNNNNITLAGILTDNNSTGYVRLTLGSSTINCTNVVFGSASTLTVDSNTAAINITSTVDINANFGSKTWGGTTTVLMTGGKTFTLLGTNTFNKFAISWTSDHISSIFTLAANQTFTNSTSNAFKVTGASTISRPRIKSVSSGSQRTINAATINITGAVDFKDISADGTSAPWDLSGIDTGNQGGNSDIVFRTPATYYVSCGSTNTTYWNSSDIFSIANDGTADGLSVFPLPQDSSIINDSTWSDTGNTLQIVGNGFGNIDTSALTEAQTIILGSGDYFGDLILTGTSKNITISSTAQT